MDAAGDIVSDYEKILSLTSEETIPVEIYRSKSTGLRIAICPVPGPLVNGYFLLATEAHDDDGLPHTLEHLVFLGSEDYPYKGVLDLLANRCFAQGTNAWTDTDHTCYTVETAGVEGFLNFMPIYVEHILYPTLTDEAFLTEVYHITETGEDAGVVYCEMQGRENSGESRTYLELLREMYPGECGFKSETGGIMKNLRESTNNEKTLDPICEKIRRKLKEKPLVKMDRPWSTPVPPLTSSVTRTVEFGNDTEDKGHVMLGFRGSKATEIYSSVCEQIILDYFTDTSAAPLMQAFVERDDAICSNVKYGAMEATESTIYFKFSNVCCKDLSSVTSKFFEVTKAELSNGLNMERIKALVEKKRLEVLNSLEDAPHDSISGDVIGHILFGQHESELEQRLNTTKLLLRAARETEEFWVKLMQDLISKPHVEIIGKPSIAEKTRLASEVQERLEKRKAELGEDGLKLKGQLLQKAVDANEVEAPDELAEMLPVPDPAKIDFHNLRASSNYRRGDDDTKVPLKLFPFIAHLDDIQQTQFISWTFLVDTSAMLDDLKPYLMLWTELFGETAVKDESGTLISYEDVAVGLERDFLHYSCSLGALNGGRFSAGSFPETIAISMKVDRDSNLDKYVKGVTWLSRLMFRAELTTERVKNVIQKVLKSVDQCKRNGRHVVNATHLRMKAKETSNTYHTLVLNQEKILQKCIEMLDNQPDTLLGILARITQHMQQLCYLRLHLTAAVSKLTCPESLTQPWRDIFLVSLGCKGDAIPNYAAYNVVKSSALFKNIDQVEEAQRSQIVSVGAVESSFLMFSKPVDISTYDHPDIAPLMVLMEYISATEGPMWRLIRGLGYSYGYMLRLSIEHSCLLFSLIKATHLPKAFEKAVEIVKGFVDGSEEWEPAIVDASKSSVMFEVIEREKTIGDASSESLVNHLRHMHKDYNRKLLKQVDKVTIEDVERVCSKYLSTLFDASSSFCAVVCHPTKVDEICGEFANMPDKAARHFKKFECFEDVFKQ